MDTFDGRGLAIGLALGAGVGLLIWMFSGSALWISVMAPIGAVIGMNAGFGRRDD